jgi:lysine 2,3-aminomutase
MERRAENLNSKTLAKAISPKMSRLVEAGDESIRLQFVPQEGELVFLPEELTDPIGDLVHSPVKGVTHRYPDRALLAATYLCGVYCRFCFRREWVSDAGNNLTEPEMDTAFAYLERQNQLWELILTGGDPLVLPAVQMRALMRRIRRLDKVKILRLHTRIPSVAPERVNAELLSALAESGKTVWMATHVNSASEIDDGFRSAAQRLKSAGVHLVSQTVLLRGVNNSADKLVALFRRLVESGVKPYYLHYPDLAQGTSHFRIPLTEAIDLCADLRGRISGLCLPQLIVDIPGGRGKVVAERQWIQAVGPHRYRMFSPLERRWVEVVYPMSEPSRG